MYTRQVENPKGQLGQKWASRWTENPKGRFRQKLGIKQKKMYTRQVENPKGRLGKKRVPWWAENPKGRSRQKLRIKSVWLCLVESIQSILSSRSKFKRSKINPINFYQWQETFEDIGAIVYLEGNEIISHGYLFSFSMFVFLSKISSY